MESPLKKEWRDNRELAQVVGEKSCLIFKDGNRVVSACNKEGKIEVTKREID